MKLFNVLLILIFTNLFTEKINVSIIIPCYHKHFLHLDPLLQEYKKQTCLPDEIIISLSGCDKIPFDEITELEKKTWPYTLKIIKTFKELSAGLNRNIAAENSSGDLIICQDADDFPHPQRTETITYIYKKTNFDQLIHGWEGSIKEEISDILWSAFRKRKFNLNQIQIHPNKNPDLFRFKKKLHFGNCAINKKVLKKVKWPSHQYGQDALFLNNLYQNFSKTYIIFEPLLFYRPFNGHYHNSQNPEKIF